VSVGSAPITTFDGKPTEKRSTTMRTPLIAVITATMLMAGCAPKQMGGSVSATDVLLVGKANDTVREYYTAPAGSRVIGKVESTRCKRWSDAPVPTRQEIILDLKLAAYRKGASGITDVKIKEGSGLLSNCWNLAEGQATAITTNGGPSTPLPVSSYPENRQPIVQSQAQPQASDANICESAGQLAATSYRARRDGRHSLEWLMADSSRRTSDWSPAYREVAREAVQIGYHSSSAAEARSEAVDYCMRKVQRTG